MRRICLLGALSAFIATSHFSGAALADGQDRPTGDRERLVGAWHMVRLETPAPDGNVRTVDCTGMLVFTREGRIAIQVMIRTPQTASEEGPARSVQYSQGGYEATFGRYDLDERTHTFTYHVEGSLVRDLVGKDLPRVYELNGSRLTIKSANPAERWLATWEHY